MKRFNVFLLTIAPAMTLMSTSCNKLNDPIEPEQKVYIVHKCTDLTSLDWSIVPQASINIFKWNEDGPVYDSFAQMLYVDDHARDMNGFAIRLLSYEPDPLVNPSLEEKDIYKNSCLEVFLNFGKENKYLNGEVDSEWETCQQFGLPWSSGQERMSINDTDYRFVVATAMSEKTEQYWTTTLFISVESICYWYESDLSPDDFVSGFTFTGNFFKICGTKGPKEHYGMWNNVDNEEHTFHDPNQFGKLIIE